MRSSLPLTAGAVLAAALCSSSAHANPSFRPPSPIAVGKAPIAVVAGRFDAGGSVDLAVMSGRYPFGLSVLLGTGAGAFGPPQLHPNYRGVAMAAADFDHDGATDLVTSGYYYDPNAGFWHGELLFGRGNGAGAFASSPARLVLSAPPAVDLATADFDGDGNLDVATADSSRGLGSFAPSVGVSVLLGNGGGGFVEHDLLLASSAAIAAADVDADGRVDLVVANESPSALVTLRGDGSGGFSVASSRAIGGSDDLGSLRLVDVDRDGRLDALLVDRTTARVLFLRGDGTGAFAAPSAIATGGHPWRLQAADLDLDGTIDLAVVEATEDDLAVLPGDGLGGFGAPLSIAVARDPLDLAAADLDGDGVTDLATVDNFTTNRDDPSADQSSGAVVINAAVRCDNVMKTIYQGKSAMIALPCRGHVVTRRIFPPPPVGGQISGLVGPGPWDVGAKVGFTADSGFVGTATFPYLALGLNGNPSNLATVTIVIKEMPVTLGRPPRFPIDPPPATLHWPIDLWGPPVGPWGPRVAEATGLPPDAEVIDVPAEIAAQLPWLIAREAGHLARVRYGDLLGVLDEETLVTVGNLAPATRAGLVAEVEAAVGAGGKVWFASGTTLYRAPAAGGPAEAAARAESPIEMLATDGRMIYFSARGTEGRLYRDGAVLSLPVARGRLTTVAREQPYPQGLVVEGLTLCWANAGPGATSPSEPSVACVTVERRGEP